MIRVEPPNGDPTRGHFTTSQMPGQRTAYNVAWNRGKQTISLNLKDKDECAILDDLLSVADVFISNYRPGVLDKLGFSWERLKTKFPRNSVGRFHVTFVN